MSRDSHRCDWILIPCLQTLLPASVLPLQDMFWPLSEFDLAATIAGCQAQWGVTPRENWATLNLANKVQVRVRVRVRIRVKLGLEFRLGSGLGLRLDFERGCVRQYQWSCVYPHRCNLKVEQRVRRMHGYAKCVRCQAKRPEPYTVHNLAGMSTLPVSLYLLPKSYSFLIFLVPISEPSGCEEYCFLQRPAGPVACGWCGAEHQRDCACNCH